MTASPQVTVTKFIRARRARVFRAWLDPELAVRWFSPESLTPLSFRSDAKVGGTYTHVMTGPEGPHITTVGSYLEIIENEKLVFTWGKEGVTPPESVVTVMLQDQDGGTLLTLTHSKLPDDLVPGHVAGWESALRHMVACFEGESK
ncbi:MAG: SRPBCC family protein [Polyangiaceae bacterium]